MSDGQRKKTLSDIRECLGIMTKRVTVSQVSRSTDHVLLKLCQAVEWLLEDEAVIVQCEECGMREIVESVQSAWISVKDRLPEEKDEYGVGVYVLATDGVVTTRAFYGYPGGHDEWFINAGEQWEATFERPVTHWMPMPMPQKGGDNEDK